MLLCDNVIHHWYNACHMGGVTGFAGTQSVALALCMCMNLIEGLQEKGLSQNRQQGLRKLLQAL